MNGTHTHYRCDDWVGSSPKGACGHEGWMVGRFFVVVEGGRHVFQPDGTDLRVLSGACGRPKKPIWDVQEPIYNTQDRWTCREACSNYKSWETMFHLPEVCTGVGVDDVGRKGGTVTA